MANDEADDPFLRERRRYEGQQFEAIGRGVARLIELAARDDELRDGLRALARLIETDTKDTSGSVVAPAETVAIEVDVNQTAAELAPESRPQPAGPSTNLVDAAPAPRKREHHDSVPMDRAALLQLLESAAKGLPEEERGTLAGKLIEQPESKDEGLASAADNVTNNFGDEHGYDQVLPGLRVRTRLRADVTRALAASRRGGADVDEALMHRARSEGCALWMLELASPDPGALDLFADCLAAISDCASLLVLTGGEPRQPGDRALALRGLAGAQSSLRVAARELRASHDEDQIAAFNFLKAATSAERVFVERHMRLDDPLDPAELPSVMGPIWDRLDDAAKATDAGEAQRKLLKQASYHASRIRRDRGTDHDMDKLVESIAELVREGLPYSSTQLRNLLLPILDRMPVSDGLPKEYLRVIADVAEHRQRIGKTATPKAPAKARVSAEVRQAAALLRGTAIVLIGGERRVEQERALREAFGLSGLTWITLSDDPSPDEIERAIAKPDISVVFQLIRWSRHRFGDAAEVADKHDKPFVRVPAGYNANALAKAVLDQASERLGRDGHH